MSTINLLLSPGRGAHLFQARLKVGFFEMVAYTKLMVSVFNHIKLKYTVAKLKVHEVRGHTNNDCTIVRLSIVMYYCFHFELYLVSNLPFE